MATKRVIQANYAEATKYIAKGARVYVSNVNYGNGSERVLIVARSRGGRWVEKWESIKRLTNFRLKTLPLEHPKHKDDRIADFYNEATVLNLESARRRALGE